MAGFSVSFWERKLQDADLFTKERAEKLKPHSNAPGGHGQRHETI